MRGTLEAFGTMGGWLAERWEAAQLEDAAFPALALEALQRHSLPAPDPLGLLAWAADAPLPPQVNLEATFGEPPVTVFRHPRFYVELLFWLDGTTSIHHHGFSGAFQVLSGSSLHLRHVFQVREQVSPFLQLGDLSVEHAERLQTGDARAIPVGPPLIHSLFHLDRPSVSVVVRTFQDVARTPQLKYLRPHVAVDTEHRDEAGTRRLQALQSLSQLSPGRYATLVSELVSRLDLEGAFHVLKHANGVLGHTPLFARLLAAASARHGAAVAQLERVFEEARRDAVLKTQRALVHAPEERFFVALVLNLPSRAAVLSFLAEAFPGEPPVERAAQLFERVTRPEADPKQAARTALEWTPERRETLRALLRGEPRPDDPFAAQLLLHPYRRLFATS